MTSNKTGLLVLGFHCCKCVFWLFSVLLKVADIVRLIITTKNPVTATHNPNHDTSVVRLIFRVANKSRKPPDDAFPSSGGLGTSKGCWGISLPLNRATFARIFSAFSTLPFTRSYLGDSGMSLCVSNNLYYLATRFISRNKCMTCHAVCGV